MQVIPNGNKKGISIIEILVVIAVMAITLTSLLGLASFSLSATSLMRQTVRANTIAQETAEAVRNFRDNSAWNINGLGILKVDTSYHPEKTTDVPPKWKLVEGEENLNNFTRKVVFKTVYRDGDDNIAESGAEDPDTKKAMMTVSWQEKGRTHQVEIITYLTNWKQ